MRYSTMKKTLLSLCLTCLLTTPCYSTDCTAGMAEPVCYRKKTNWHHILIYGLMRMLMLRVKGIMSNHLII